MAKLKKLKKRLVGLKEGGITSDERSQVTNLRGKIKKKKANLVTKSTGFGKIEDPAQKTIAALGLISEDTPFGSATYKVNTDKAGNIKKIKRNVTLTPEQQAILRSEEALAQQGLGATRTQLGRVEDVMATPFDTSGLTDVTPFSTAGFSPQAEANDEIRQRIEDALYGRATSRLDPQFEEDQRRLETQLVNQGFARGSEGYTKALEDFGRTRNDAYETARRAAIEAGGAEQSRLFGLESQARQQDLSELLARIGTESGARQQGLSELLTARGLPFQELAAVSGLGGGTTVPQFGATPNLATAGLAGDQLGFNQQQAQQQKKTSLWDSIFNLGGNILGNWLGGGSGGSAWAGA